MLYSRSFQELNGKTQTWLFHNFKKLISWFSSTRFSNHISIILIVLAVIFPGTGLTNYSKEIMESNLNNNSFEEDLLMPEDNIAYNINNDSIVKPYLPFTEQTYGYNPFIKIYTVVEGDTLENIAKTHNITPKAIKLANELSSNKIKAGQQLKIPPAEGIFYKVTENDTVTSLSKRFKIDPQEIINVNEIIDPEQIGIGKHIILPGVEPTTIPTSTPKSTPKNRPDSSSSPVILPLGDGKFGMPVNRNACIRTQGYHSGHPAVDLASKGGKAIPIYASASGTISYAGWRGGYGKTVLINHHNGFHTLYGHFNSIAVNSGQNVKRGQVIGYMGTTGASTGVHLHFEICTNGCNGYSTNTRINPKRYGIY